MSDDNSFLWTTGGWFGLVSHGMSHRCADPAPRKRRVLICDDHAFFATCLRTLLENEPDLSVCDIVSRAAELQDRIARLEPDVIVIDITLGAECGFELGRGLRANGATTPILFVSTLTIPTSEQLAAVSGSAFIRKGTAPAIFLGVLRGLLSHQNAATRPDGLALAPTPTRS